jgi:hypothetical protein
MSDQDKSAQPASYEYEVTPLVLAAGDEGVQLNHGRRFAFAGAGFRLSHFEKVAAALQKTIKDHFPVEQLDRQLKLAASEENAWLKNRLELNDWDETNASMQQHLEALADQNKFHYVGILPFADPEELGADVKGHMVRPHNLHLANKICFTIAGGEETYNLGQYLISADWLAEFTKNGKKNLAEAKEVLTQQVEHYKKLAKNDQLPTLIEDQGPLPSEIIEQNRQILAEILN